MVYDTNPTCLKVLYGRQPPPPVVISRAENSNHSFGLKIDKIGKSSKTIPPPLYNINSAGYSVKPSAYLCRTWFAAAVFHRRGNSAGRVVYKIRNNKTDSSVYIYILTIAAI